MGRRGCLPQLRTNDPQALLHGNIAFADYGAAEVVAAPGHVPAGAGGGAAVEHIL